MIVKSPILFDYIKNVHYLNYCLPGVEWRQLFMPVLQASVFG